MKVKDAGWDVNGFVYASVAGRPGEAIRGVIWELSRITGTSWKYIAWGIEAFDLNSNRTRFLDGKMIRGMGLGKYWQELSKPDGRAVIPLTNQRKRVIRNMGYAGKITSDQQDNHLIVWRLSVNLNSGDSHIYVTDLNIGAVPYESGSRVVHSPLKALAQKLAG